MKSTDLIEMIGEMIMVIGSAFLGAYIGTNPSNILTNPPLLLSSCFVIALGVVLKFIKKF